MPNAGYPDVREALARKVSREQGLTLDGSCLVMAVGAAGGLNVVFKTILNPGDEVIVSRPYFMEYRPYVSNHGGRLVEVDALPDFNLDIEAIRARLSPKTAAVLINSPHNPTGRVYPAAAIQTLAKALEAHGKAAGSAHRHDQAGTVKGKPLFPGHFLCQRLPDTGVPGVGHIPVGTFGIFTGHL
jgi:aspartate aminotransferase